MACGIFVEASKEASNLSSQFWCCQVLSVVAFADSLFVQRNGAVAGI